MQLRPSPCAPFGSSRAGTACKFVRARVGPRPVARYILPSVTPGQWSVRNEGEGKCSPFKSVPSSAAPQQ